MIIDAPPPKIVSAPRSRQIDRREVEDSPHRQSTALGKIDSCSLINQRTRVLALPGLMEQILVVVATFIFYHQTPNAWSLTAKDLDENFSNPIAALLQLALIGIAFARVAGYIDHLITIVRSESAVFLFAGLTFASIFWSADPTETLRRSVMFVAVTMFASYLILRFPLERIIMLLAVMFVISSLVNLSWIVAFPEYGIDELGRYTGVFAQKNALGYTSALAIPTLIIAGRSTRSLQLVFFASALLHLGLLLRSESKTMLVAGLVPTLLMGVYHLFRSRKTLRGAVLLSLGGSTLFTVAFATANIGLLAKWLDKDVSLTGRVPLWGGLLTVAEERPVFGHGYAAAFGGYFSPIHEVWIQNQWEPGDAHNALMQIWLEVGMLGVLLFLLTYTRAVTRAIKIVAIVPGAVGLWPIVFLTSTLLVSITETGMQSDYLGWTMYTVAVLSVGLHLKHRTSLGLSNDLADATRANNEHMPVR